MLKSIPRVCHQQSTWINVPKFWNKMHCFKLSWVCMLYDKSNWSCRIKLRYFPPALSHPGGARVLSQMSHASSLPNWSLRLTDSVLSSDQFTLWTCTFYLQNGENYTQCFSSEINHQLICLKYWQYSKQVAKSKLYFL